MLRAPICTTSACSAIASACVVSRNSVTTGSPVSARASARISSPGTPSPLNANGDVRGLNAPPRSIDAPPALTIRATSSVCSRDSTVHGPAIRQNVALPPTVRPLTLNALGALWLSSSEASLYGREIGTTRSTPGIPSRPSSRTPSGSPIAPIAVVSSPGITSTCTPVVSSRLRTAAISASPAVGVITIIKAFGTLSQSGHDHPEHARLAHRRRVAPAPRASGVERQRVAGGEPVGLAFDLDVERPRQHVHELRLAAEAVRVVPAAATGRDVGLDHLQPPLARGRELELVAAVAADRDRRTVVRTHQRPGGQLEQLADADAERLAEAQQRADRRRHEVALDLREEPLGQPRTGRQVGQRHPARQPCRAQTGADAGRSPASLLRGLHHVEGTLVARDRDQRRRARRAPGPPFRRVRGVLRPANAVPGTAAGARFGRACLSRRRPYRARDPARRPGRARACGDGAGARPPVLARAQ